MTETFYKKGDKVQLMFEEQGEIKKTENLVWFNRYSVQIIKSNGFNKKGEIISVLEKDILDCIV